MAHNTYEGLSSAGNFARGSRCALAKVTQATGRILEISSSSFRKLQPHATDCVSFPRSLSLSLTRSLCLSLSLSFSPMTRTFSIFLSQPNGLRSKMTLSNPVMRKGSHHWRAINHLRAVSQQGRLTTKSESLDDGTGQPEYQHVSPTNAASRNQYGVSKDVFFLACRVHRSHIVVVIHQFIEGFNSYRVFIIDSLGDIYVLFLYSNAVLLNDCVLIEGQTTRAFRRQRRTFRNRVCRSLTLELVDDHEHESAVESVNLVAKSLEDYQKLTKVLRQLVDGYTPRAQN